MKEKTPIKIAAYGNLRQTLFFAVLLFPVFAAALTYQQEYIYDTTAYPDESAVNVCVSNSRYPNCNTLQDCIQDIFRIEGAQNDHQKMMALWKWFVVQLFKVGTGGIPSYREKYVYDPAKILTVYGAGECEISAMAMVGLWRAAGYIAYDQASSGHTFASFRYRDADGLMRMHDTDPNFQKIYWNISQNRLSPKTIPVIKASAGFVYRHIVAPQTAHSLRTSLRLGETIERRWFNTGHIMDSTSLGHGVEAAGEEQQLFSADTSPSTYQMSLYAGSANTACSAPSAGSAILHPASAGQLGSFIYRMTSPFPAVACTSRVVLVKTDNSDVCRLMFSKDGGVNWTTLVNKTTTGTETTTVALPNITCAYTLLIKAEFQTSGSPGQVGMNSLDFAAYRQLNFGILPKLLFGANYYKITTDTIIPGYGIRVEVKYKKFPTATTMLYAIDTFTRFPSYFKVTIAGQLDPAMNSIQMKMVPCSELFERNDTMEAMFHQPCTLRGAAGTYTSIGAESSNLQVSGFFPQSTLRLTSAPPSATVNNLYNGGEIARWTAAEELGAYPLAVDTLMRALGYANPDLALFLMKALAQIADPKTLTGMLAYWQRAPNGTPGMRYAPDVFAAIGDTIAVPDLVAKIPECRFDLRFHIAHALGFLDCALSRSTLQDMVVNDPYRAIREMAQESIDRLTNGINQRPVYRGNESAILFPNYPNPFNPVTHIPFQVPWSMGQSADVKISVHNPAGSLIRTLFSGKKSPGLYILPWNGRDDEARSVGSGTYFLRMEVNETVLQKKAILLK
ncbi:MAG: FlgD immunoglobulin-like domain containing protein [Fibrobacterota bacterium]